MVKGAFPKRLQEDGKHNEAVSFVHGATVLPESLLAKTYLKIPPNIVSDRPRFMIFAFQSAAPRAKAANTIEMRSFCAYRDSLLFWADHYYFLREETFDRRKLFNDLVSATRRGGWSSRPMLSTGSRI